MLSYIHMFVFFTNTVCVYRVYTVCVYVCVCVCVCDGVGGVGAPYTLPIHLSAPINI